MSVSLPVELWRRETRGLEARGHGQSNREETTGLLDNLSLLTNLCSGRDITMAPATVNMTPTDSGQTIDTTIRTSRARANTARASQVTVCENTYTCCGVGIARPISD